MLITESSDRFSLVVALMATFLANSSASWSADDLWDQHMQAGETAYRTGLEQKYHVGWGTARPTLGFTKAEEEFLDAIAVAQGLPNGDLRKAEAMSALAGTYTEEGKFSDAENSSNQALAIVEASVPSDDPRLGAALIHLAVIYDSESQPQRASALWKRALPILKKAGGVDSEVLQQLTIMASNLAGHVNPDGPAQMFRAILELSEAAGASDNDLRIVLKHLAVLQKGLDAEQDYTRILELDQKLFGSDNPMTGNDLQWLGRLYLEEGKYKAALPVLQRTLEIKQQTVRPSGSKLAKTFEAYALNELNRQLAEAYANTGNAQGAEELFRQLISADETEIKRERVSGARNLSDDLIGLSRVYCGEQRYAEALDSIRRSELANASIPEPKPRNDKPENPEAMSIWIWSTQNARAEIYREQGDNAAAETLFRNSLDIAPTLGLVPGHPKLARLLDNYATLLRDEGRYGEAESLYKRALDTWARSRYPEHPDVAETLTHYAALLAKLDRPAEAELLATRAATIRVNLDSSHSVN
jgi:tetratricopeptide (TPR) repeat protein